MNSEDHSNQPAHKAQSNNSPVPAPVPQQDIPQNSENKTNANESSTLKRLVSEVRIVELLALAVNAGLAIIGIIALCIYGGQLSVMRGTLDEMKRSGSEATNQAWQAIGNVHWLAQEMNYSVQQSRTAIAESERQSRAALNASIEVSRNDLRAWLGPRAFNSKFTDGGKTVYIKTGEKSIFEVELTNTGRTPAVAVQFSIGDAMVPAASAFGPFYTTPDNPERADGVSLPQQVQFLTTSGDHVFTQPEVDAVKSGVARVYIWGLVTYKDVFGREHKTTFCSFVNRSLDAVLVCPTYNTAN